MADGEPIQAVLPADLVIDVNELRALVGAYDLRLAREDELALFYRDCEVGAMPPLGPLYRQRVFVDRALAADPYIVFSAGTHRDAIRMRFGDFAKLAKPIVGVFACSRR